MKYIFIVFYYLIQFTWGFLQNFIGLLFFLFTKKSKVVFYKGALIGYHKKDWGGISLGIFILISGNKTKEWIKDTEIHEYGHTIQSLILGPLYLLIIGIPSFIWCNAKKCILYRKEKDVSYFSFYPEKWANFLGERFTGERIQKQ